MRVAFVTSVGLLFQCTCIVGVSLPKRSDDSNGVTKISSISNDGSGTGTENIYLVSETMTLKVVRYKADVLKECQHWNNTEALDPGNSPSIAVSERLMRDLVKQCKRASDDGAGSKVIYPGTKWCGNGNEADNDDDLGELEGLDKCCRAHDQCRPSIEAFDTKFGLYNFAIWTKKHCRCDKKFYNCLKRDNSSDADTVGSTFFNVLGVGCFQKVRPLKCVKYSFLGLVCSKYKPDRSKPKEWAFVDNKWDY